MRLSIGLVVPHYCIDLRFLVLMIKLGPSHMVNGHNAISLSNNPSDFLKILKWCLTELPKKSLAPTSQVSLTTDLCP